jgi:Reverse transcriptase (RNA-dependent DNA polymerase)
LKYLNAPTKEKNWFKAGIEFGPDNVGKPVLIVRALYGLRSSGAMWRQHMANTLTAADFQSCKADPDVWMRPAMKGNGEKYYEYVLCYVDDILCCSERPKLIMDYLASVYTLKAGLVKEPDVYLGADVKKFAIGVDQSAWGISPDLYCKTTVKEVERKLAEIGQKLATRVSTPMSSGYRPEMDVTPELKPELSSYYQSLIGVLRWAVELGRVDIIVETGKLSRYCITPRLGHLEQVLHIFAYLKRFSSCSMVFNWHEPSFDESKFKVCDWTSNYPGAKEAIPPNMPEPRGKSVLTSCYVDADHAGCLATRRSHTGVLLFVNGGLLLCSLWGACDPVERCGLFGFSMWMHRGDVGSKECAPYCVFFRSSELECGDCEILANEKQPSAGYDIYLDLVNIPANNALFFTSERQRWQSVTTGISSTCVAASCPSSWMTSITAPPTRPWTVPAACWAARGPRKSGPPTC